MDIDFDIIEQTSGKETLKYETIEGYSRGVSTGKASIVLAILSKWC